MDTVSLSLGRHQFKFGVDYRRLTPFAILPTPIAVRTIYLSESAVETNSASTRLCKRLLPLIRCTRTFRRLPRTNGELSQRLNLSLGLRWEVNPAPGVTQGLKPYTIQGSSPNTWTLAPQGTPLWQTTWYNFAPRLGAAYVSIMRRAGKRLCAAGWRFLRYRSTVGVTRASMGRDLVHYSVCVRHRFRCLPEWFLPS